MGNGKWGMGNGERECYPSSLPQIWRNFSTDAAKKFFSKSHENATLRAFLRTIQDRHAAGV